jgi:hypothetical protein
MLTGIFLIVSSETMKRPSTQSRKSWECGYQQAAARGFVSGRVYDALLLQCAAKVKAETIYTWHLKHFRAIRPDEAERMRTP